MDGYHGSDSSVNRLPFFSRTRSFTEASPDDNAVYDEQSDRRIRDISQQENVNQQRTGHDRPEKYPGIRNQARNQKSSPS